jgi:hypothetical protein
MKKISILLLVIIMMTFQNYAQKNTKIQRIMNDSSISLESKIYQLKNDSSIYGTKQRKFLARLEWFASIRMDNSGELNQHFKKLDSAIVRKNRNKSLRYSSGNEYYYIGANGLESTSGIGRIDALWVDPDNPDYMLAGACTGGLWEKADATSDWVNITDNSGIQGGVWGIAVHKSSGAIQAIYIITTQYSNNLMYYGKVSRGVYKTVDGGNTWTVITGSINLNDEYLTCIKVDPKEPTGQTLLLTTDKSIYKSTNGGSSWSTILTQDNLIFLDIDYHPDPNSNEIVVSGKTNVKYISGQRIKGTKSIYRSTNSGTMFNPIDLPVLTSNPTFHITRMQAEYKKRILMIYI